MEYWGIAYAGGPNYNKAWERFDETDLKRALSKCHLASSKARELASIPLEIALIEALCDRFHSDREGDYKHWNRTYCEEMDKVYEIHGDHLDVIALYADSLMEFAPWRLWDLSHWRFPEGQSYLLAYPVNPREITSKSRISLPPWYPPLLHPSYGVIFQSGARHSRV